MSTLTASMSYEDLHKDHGGKLYELVRGDLVEKTMAAEAVWIVTQISMLLKVLSERRGEGWLFTEQPIACFPWLDRHARRPDVLYVSKQRLSTARTQVAALAVAPELCVKVISPHDDAIELDVKIAEYLRAGVQLVWVVNPTVRTVRVHRADGTITQYRADERLTGEGVVPGFDVEVAEFFPPDP